MVVAICGCTYAVAQHFMHLPDKTINFFDGKLSNPHPIPPLFVLRGMVSEPSDSFEPRPGELAWSRIEAMDDAHSEAISRTIAMTDPVCSINEPQSTVRGARPRCAPLLCGPKLSKRSIKWSAAVVRAIGSARHTGIQLSSLS
jgi:hypothetical protein